MTVTPELIDGRWVLPLPKEWLAQHPDPASVAFRVDDKMLRTDDKRSVDAAIDDAFDEMTDRYDTVLKNLAK